MRMCIMYGIIRCSTEVYHTACSDMDGFSQSSVHKCAAKLWIRIPTSVASLI